MAQWQPLIWAEENGQIIKSVGPFLDRRQRERRVYSYRRQYASASDKPTRAQSIRARIAMGKVYFPANAAWATDLVSEMLRFPAGKNDDQVDVLGLFGRMLDDLVSGTNPAPVEPMRGLTEMTMAEAWQKARPDQGRNRPQRIG
jgi:predicted phage terminase large subunit-like protein